ncbi:MAG: GNAT family N-acetyltransferase, partial [Lachnospiraceae bacterium]
DKTSCILKSPNEHDAEQMLSYFTAVSGESYFMINYPEEIKITMKEETELLKSKIESNTDIMIAAFINEEIIGNVSVYSLSDRMKMRHRACLGIAIRKEYQSKGLGRILLAEGILTAKNAGYTQIELGVFSDNEKALRLYEKSGFEKWGRTKNAFRLKDGTYRDEIIMGQLL